MQLQNLVDAMEVIAPTRLAEAWDNVGLLVGDVTQALKRVLLTIDYTPEVVEETLARKCDAVIAYHPPLFEAVKRITPTGATSLIFDAIQHGIGLYSPHTALDVVDGGTNDMLADAVGLLGRRPLRPGTSASDQYKLVTFVPEAALETVRNALFVAGAGHVGKYHSCSFSSPGTGTFFGEDGTSPTVGKAGRLEQVPEIRLETLVPISKLSAVLEALRKSHPYEEPAFDLGVLAAGPGSHGLGRIGQLERPIQVSELLAQVKKELGIASVLVAGPTERPIETVAVCAGSCGNLLDDAIRSGAQLYVTGEMRHHDALKAARAGITVFCTLHSNSERAMLPRLATRLRTMLPGVEMCVSERDRDPFSVR